MKMKLRDPCGLVIEMNIKGDISSDDKTPELAGDYITARHYGKQVKVERFEPYDNVWFNLGMFTEVEE